MTEFDSVEQVGFTDSDADPDEEQDDEFDGDSTVDGGNAESKRFEAVAPQGASEIIRGDGDGDDDDGATSAQPGAESKDKAEDGDDYESTHDPLKAAYAKAWSIDLRDLHFIRPFWATRGQYWEGSSPRHPRVLIRKASRDIIQRELEIRSTLNHPSIQRLIGACIQDQLQEEMLHSLVVEVVDFGTLEAAFVKDSDFVQQHIRGIATDVAAGLHFLHAQHKLCHRALRPRAIFLHRQVLMHVCGRLQNWRGGFWGVGGQGEGDECGNGQGSPCLECTGSLWISPSSIQRRIEGGLRETDRV